MTEQVQPRCTILIAQENVLAPVAARCYVIQAAGELDAKASRHAGSLGEATLYRKS